MKTKLLVGAVAWWAQACGGGAPPAEQPAAAPAAPEVTAPGGTEPPPASDDMPENAAAEPAEQPPADDNPPQSESNPPEPATGIAGANVSIGSIEADGLTITNLSCRADGLGLLGSIVVAGALSKKQAALGRCAKGSSPAVRWTFSQGRITEAKAAGVEPPVAACIERALLGAPAPGQGECEATLVL